MKALLIGLSLSALASPAYALGLFELPWMNHPSSPATFSSEEHPDTVFVFHVYGSWCDFSYSMEEHVNQFADDFRDNPKVQVLDLGIESPDDTYARWIDQAMPNHPVLKDTSRTVVRQLTDYLSAVSSTYVVDCSGNVTLEVVGDIASWDHQVREAVAEALEVCD